MPADIVLSTCATCARSRCSFEASVRGLATSAPRRAGATASNSSTAAAAETLSEPTLPRTGIETSASQRSATRRPQPLALAAEHEHDLAGQVGVRVRRLGARPRPRRSRRPRPSRAASQSARLRDPRDRQVLDRAGRRLADRGGDRGRAALAGSRGRPRPPPRPSGDRAEVVRVLDLVERDDQTPRASPAAPSASA